ncbi:Protein LCHN [Termitomyces sp. T112]|nr:Protein LCHN [Termitomyces sp. T112]
MTVIPQDLVAVFHASFHPTQGNVVDWSLKTSDDLNLDSIEFNVLPSGLHLIDRDVVYFTKDGQHGVCIFRRRKTEEQGQRGFRLSSFGVLLARSKRPRPWRHTAALKDLFTIIHKQCEEAGLVQPTESQWEPARAYFEERKIRKVDAREWSGWNQDFSDSTEFNSHPTLHLSQLFRILGPSSLIIYRHVLGRRRILIYTQPPVEAACILCYAAADMCYEAQLSTSGRTRDPLSVLGMVTLSDMRRLKTESGWIACTTDAIFLEKPSCYELLVDLTHSGPRPAFYLSKPVIPPPPRGQTHRLSMTHFAWSDVKLWNELDRILQLGHDRCCSENDNELLAPTTASWIGDAWADVWRVYEDACIVCAGLWMGLGWRRGAVGLEGDDDLGLSLSGSTTREGSYVRNLGMGIEGRPSVSTARTMRRSSTMSWSSGRATIVGTSGVDELGGSKAHQGSSSSGGEDGGDAEEERVDRQLCTTLALLQTLHAHTAFQLAVLASFLPPPGSESSSSGTVYLYPKDMVQFELGPLSSSDARYLEWVAQEYAGNTQVVMKRGWKDLVGALLGYT